MIPKGYIQLSRSILDHWIYENPKHFKWWLTILLNVNHSQNKFRYGNMLIDIYPGQSVVSIQSWKNKFDCTLTTTYRFFRLLEDAGMIKRENVGSGKRRKNILTVVNWEKYQSNGNYRGNEKTQIIDKNDSPKVEQYKCQINKELQPKIQYKVESKVESQVESQVESDNNVLKNDNLNKKNNRFSKEEIHGLFYAKMVSMNLDYDVDLLSSEFYDYNEMRGWMIGKTAISNIEPCIDKWIKTYKSGAKSISNKNSSNPEFSKRSNFRRPQEL